MAVRLAVLFSVAAGLSSCFCLFGRQVAFFPESNFNSDGTRDEPSALNVDIVWVTSVEKDEIAHSHKAWFLSEHRRTALGQNRVTPIEFKPSDANMTRAIDLEGASNSAIVGLMVVANYGAETKEGTTHVFFDDPPCKLSITLKKTGLAVERP